MIQRGSVHRNGSSWYLRYRDNFVVKGELVRKQVVVRLCEYSDRYRRESDLDELIAEKMANVRSAGKCPTSADSFANYVEDTYLPHVQRNMKPSTHAAYRSYWLRYIKPFTQQCVLRDFTVSIVSRLLADVAATFSVNVDTVTKVRSLLSGIFTYALGTGAFPGKSAADNPATCALIPKAKERQKTVAASRDDVIAILKHLGEKNLILARAAVALIGLTGLRPGEARGARWLDWNREEEHIKIERSIWHTHEGTPKTEGSVRCVAVAPELADILRELHKFQKSPIDGYILSHVGSKRALNLDNLSKRTIIPALTRCATCKQSEDADHKGHTFKRDETLPRWTGWYSLRRFHATAIRDQATSETTSRALGNSKEVSIKHYEKPEGVLPDVRLAVGRAMVGLVGQA